MNVLVLTECYPDNNGSVSLMYIHTRNLYYMSHGINVTVINLRAEEDYNIDGIKVITQETYEKEQKTYDLMILHAATVDYHYEFLKKYGKKFEEQLFFFHGHEVLKVNRIYPPLYPYTVNHPLAAKTHQEIHDIRKCSVWRRYFTKNIDKCTFVFVSKWMHDEFLHDVKIKEETIKGKYHNIYNCVGKEFETEDFDTDCEKEYDFITVRSNLDGSKYCIDIVNRLAKNTPDKKFLLIGRGEYFNHYEKAANLFWIDKQLSHVELVSYLQKSKFALMPTRTDAQGLMMCEMAAFGMPVITSDIPVCHEVFDGFDNAYFIDNNDEKLSLDNFDDTKVRFEKDTRYYMNNTVKKEVELIKQIIE